MGECNLRYIISANDNIYIADTIKQDKDKRELTFLTLIESGELKEVTIDVDSVISIIKEVFTEEDVTNEFTLI